ncbi:MAG: alpha/beta hydrolase [Lacisediminihabitans sp.]
MLHQSPLSSRRYQKLLPFLAEFCTPYALDTPGFGESTPPDGEWAVADYSKVVTDFAESLRPGIVFLFGRATGAVFALHAASMRKDLFDGVILHGLPVYTVEEREQRLRSFAPPYLINDSGDHFTWIWNRIHSEYPTIDASLATNLVRDFLDAGPDFATAYRAIWREDVQLWSGGLSIPTLLVGGDKDRIKYMFPRACALFPEATSVMIPEATDFVAEQDPEGFAQVIRKFIAPTV